MNAPTPPLKTQFAPRDPETMAETGPQNHPIGTVVYTDGLAFGTAAARITDQARAAAEAAVLNGPGPVIEIIETHDPEMIAFARRIRRKCEIMRLDAPRDSSLRHDLAEIITLADIIARRAGADDV